MQVQLLHLAATFQDTVPVDPLPPFDAELCCSALATCGPIVREQNIIRETQIGYSSLRSQGKSREVQQKGGNIR